MPGQMMVDRRERNDKDEREREAWTRAKQWSLRCANAPQITCLRRGSHGKK